MRRALVLLPLLALAACSSGGASDDTAAPSGAAPSAATSTTAAPASSGAPTKAAGGTAASGATVAPGVTGTAPTQAAGAGGRSASGSSQGVSGTPAGSYTYDTSGTRTVLGQSSQVDGSARLAVSPLRDGRQTSELQDDQQGTTRQTVVVRSSGSYLADLKVESPAFSKEFVFSEPVLLLPADAPRGRTWTWTATSTDGASTVTARHQVLRDEDVVVGGRKVAAVVLQTHLVISGDVDYTADVTTWASPSLRLPLKDRTKGQGSTRFGTFSFDVSTKLRSTRPA